jgi:hypothetical protein
LQSTETQSLFLEHEGKQIIFDKGLGWGKVGEGGNPLPTPC